MMRKYSIHFLTQEEPESGNSDDREIIDACPSMGSMIFESKANSYGELLRDFRLFMVNHTRGDLLKSLVLPDDKSIEKYMDYRAKDKKSDD